MAAREPDTQYLSTWEAELSRQAEELRAEISAKQAELVHVDERRTLVRRLLEIEARGPATSSSASGDCSAVGYEHAESEIVPLELEAAVAEVLRKAGKPLHITDIRQALLDLRVPIPGRGDAANIIVRLRRVDQFMRTARGTYGLSEWGLPVVSSRARKRLRRAVAK